MSRCQHFPVQVNAITGLTLYLLQLGQDINSYVSDFSWASRRAAACCLTRHHLPPNCQTSEGAQCWNSTFYEAAHEAEGPTEVRQTWLEEGRNAPQHWPPQIWVSLVLPVCVCIHQTSTLEEKWVIEIWYKAFQETGFFLSLQFFFGSHLNLTDCPHPTKTDPRGL